MVSIVIPAYNPQSFLLEAIASAAAQTHPRTEIILVNDGSNRADSAGVLAQASQLAGSYIEQPNLGLGAARNAGFRAARGEFVVPLDADDLLEPLYIADCLAALGHSDAAFVYTDFQVFGDQSFRERPGEYNLYRLMDRNYLSYAALIRKTDWEAAGGYDEPMKGYEDWEFWLRLGSRGRFGQYLPKPLFRYRKHGVSMYDDARARHRDLVAYIHNLHPELFCYQNHARIKARWSPAATIIANDYPTNQTIEDIQVIAPGEKPIAPVILNAIDSPLEPEAAELAALGAWAGGTGGQRFAPKTLAGGTLHRHLSNAELLSLRSWTHHPLRSFARLIPLRLKERINAIAGQKVFDLSFYLQFQPNSVIVDDSVVEPLVYFPKTDDNLTRIALITTHLGPGGAEAVLYDIASTLCSGRFQVLLFATQSRDDRWLVKWRDRVSHVYDLAQAVNPDRMTGALCSAIMNWRCDYLLLQNSLYGYSALPHIKKLRPAIQTVDIVHYIDEDWDQVESTSEVASYIDRRVALADSVRQRLVAAGTPASKILSIRNGVDLERFRATPINPPDSVKQVLFAARLTSRKRPLLLVDIARELSRLRPHRDFRFVIAGDGPEEDKFRRLVHKHKFEALFDFRGQVNDIAPLLAACDLLIHPSRSEGVPLILLEALASARPVVASSAGAIPEVLDSSCGVLIKEPSAGEFARAIHSLLNESAMRQSMGDAGRRKMEDQHDIRKTLGELTAIFDQGSSVSSTSRSTAIE